MLVVRGDVAMRSTHKIVTKLDIERLTWSIFLLSIGS